MMLLTFIWSYAFWAITYLNSSLIWDILSSSTRFVYTSSSTLMTLMWDFWLEIQFCLFMTQVLHINSENSSSSKLFAEFTSMSMLMLTRRLTFIIFRWANHLCHWHHDVLTDSELLVRLTWKFEKLIDVFMKYASSSFLESMRTTSLLKFMKRNSSFFILHVYSLTFIWSTDIKL